MRVLTGYEWPTVGRVRVLGETFGATEIAALRRHIGWVSSSLEHRVPDADTALEVVVSGLEAALGVYRIYTDNEWRLASRALAAAGAGVVERQAWGTLSQGERQRVLIARALVVRPRLLFLDEPCAGLDPVARESLLSDLGRMLKRRDAPTLVLVTHHIEEIGPWITHVLMLRAGRLLASGARQEVLTETALSAAFGRRCRLERHDGRCFMRFGGGSYSSPSAARTTRRRSVSR